MSSNYSVNISTSTPSEEEISKALGRTIAKFRQKSDLTQAQVAEALNLSNDAISRMERGNIMPSVARLMQFSDLFGCSTAELITQSGYSVHDHTRRINQLLDKLGDSEREQLVQIIESMVKWRKDSN